MPMKTLVFLISLVPENLLLRVYHVKTKKKWEGQKLVHFLLQVNLVSLLWGTRNRGNLQQTWTPDPCHFLLNLMVIPRIKLQAFTSQVRGFNLLRFQVLKVSSRVFPTSDSDSSSSISITMQFSVIGWIDHVPRGLPGYAIYQLL